MIFFQCTLLVGLIVSSVAALTQKKLLNAVIIFSVFGLIMSLIWVSLQAPDLAITEAAVGAGVTGVLLFLTLKKTENLKGGKKDEKH